MPFNGNGLYLPPTPEYPAVSGTIIEADDWNAIVSDIAAALSNCITRDGQSPATANLPMGGFGITNASTIGLSGLITQGGVTGRVVPVGGIIMYDGLVASIPAGWALCDGTNGTPDLRDKFVIGAWVDDAGEAKTNITGAPTKSGGSKDAQVVAHTHGVSLSGTTGFQSANHTHGVSDPGHAHNVPITKGAYDGGAPYVASGYNLDGTYNQATSAVGTGISLGVNTANHTHSITVSGSTVSSGVSGTDANLVPYYALAFIKCLAA